MSARLSQFWATNEAKHQDLIRDGHSDAECAAQLGCSLAAARQKRQGYGLEAPAPLVRPATQRPRLSHVIDLEPAPYAVPIPRPAKVQLNGKYRHAVWLSDTHMGYEDPAAIAVILGIIKDVRPDVVIHGGDLCDAYSISSFNKNPDRLGSLQDEIDKARHLLHQISQIVPKARKVLLEGNHEARLTKTIWSLPGTASELARLRAFKSAMVWPNLLALDEIGWEFVPVSRQPAVDILPKLALKHGELARKFSGMSARAEYDKYTMSGISGHTHRLAKFYRRDLRDGHVWVEGGCSCRITDVEYARHPDWQQGCVEITHSRSAGWFQAQEIYIESGRALWSGKEFAA
jgi:hypothetical protein